MRPVGPFACLRAAELRPGTVDDTADIADRLRAALTARDLDAFGMLLSDDVRWGSDDHRRACRNRSDVLATFGVTP